MKATSTDSILRPGSAEELLLLDRVASIFETRDPRAAEHLERMAAVTGLLAQRLGMPADEVWMIRAAASLHDIGKLTVSSAILKKSGPLDPAERSAVER